MEALFDSNNIDETNYYRFVERADGLYLIIYPICISNTTDMMTEEQLMQIRSIISNKKSFYRYELLKEDVLYTFITSELATKIINKITYLHSDFFIRLSEQCRIDAIETASEMS